MAYFAASTDPAAKNKKFAESLSCDYPILSDPEKTVAKTLGVLHPNGKFARRWTYYISKDGKVAFIDRRVNARNHGQDVANKLKELGIAEK